MQRATPNRPACGRSVKRPERQRRRGRQTGGGLLVSRICLFLKESVLRCNPRLCQWSQITLFVPSQSGSGFRLPSPHRPPSPCVIKADPGSRLHLTPTFCVRVCDWVTGRKERLLFKEKVNPLVPHHPRLAPLPPMSVFPCGGGSENKSPFLAPHVLPSTIRGWQPAGVVLRRIN